MDAPARSGLSAALPSVAGEDALERWSRQFADRDADSGESEIATKIAWALEHRRLDDAIFWQRVKLRARRMRALVRTRPGATGGAGAFDIVRRPL